jgi:shikimate dehydrogenase
MPLKEEALSLGFNADLRTLQTQSANTLYRRNGQWNLTSTDGIGLVSALTHAGLIELRKVLILGAGGTARAVTGALDSIVTEIHVLGRSSNRQEAIERAINNASFQYYNWSREIDFSLYDLVINATPAGASDELANFVQKNLESTLFDVNYKPWPSLLAQRWEDSGGKVINGLELLLFQGIEALEIVLNRKLDRLVLANHLRGVLGSRI